MMRRAADIAQALAVRAEDVAVSLLGRPSFVTHREMRWGRRGSLALCRGGPRRGQFYDHERGQGGDLLSLIARQHGVRLPSAMEIAQRDYLGEMPARRLTPAKDDAEARMQAAARLWGEASALAGTAGARYFIATRKLDVRRLDLDHALRWHAGEHCVTALMTDPVSGAPTGVHRTYLTEQAEKRARRMLGRKGVVRLSRDDDVTLGLGLTEGIEDGLAVLLSGWSPVWAAGDAGSLARFPILPGIERNWGQSAFFAGSLLCILT